MNPFRRMVIVGHNARAFVYNRRLTEQEETVKQQLEGDMQRDASYWGRALSNPPPGCLWRLWRSASTLTEPFRPDGNIFCWCFSDNQRVPSEIYMVRLWPTITIPAVDSSPDGNFGKIMEPEDTRFNQVLDRAEAFLRMSKEDRSRYFSDPLHRARPERIIPLPSTKAHL